jgi:hypothetical protein
MDERWVQRKEKGVYFSGGLDKINSTKRELVSCKADDVISVGKNTVRECEGKQGFGKTKLFIKKIFGERF